MRTKSSLSVLVGGTGLLALFVAVAQPAAAFCGFYVGGGGAELFADATQVALMRSGTKTVLSMQNRYSGPAEGFAMIVPVPQVLMQDDVKTLNPELFAQLDTLTSPRLVEYWEQDPCAERDYYGDGDGDGDGDGAGDGDGDGDVVVEAEFVVGEYEVQVLSSNDATALDTWLQAEGYNVPDGAAPYYQPYVEGGMFFFAAKVNPELVTFDAAGNVVLSPLRFAYDSNDFSLPVRLGMINSQGEQDLIVYLLAEDQRYKVANLDNVFIPTNLEVVNEVRDGFGTFYRNLFARTLEAHPGAAITEYAWNSGSCDPCPAGDVTLSGDDLASLGGDVINALTPNAISQGRATVTRIHLRYGEDGLGEDLVFTAADAVVGGREVYDWSGEEPQLETGASPNSWRNNFQARYIIRHRWQGPVQCEEPYYAVWGGDPNGSGGVEVFSAPSPNTTGEAVFGGEGDVPVEEQVYDEIPDLDVEPATERPTSTPPGGEGDPGQDDNDAGQPTGNAAPDDGESAALCACGRPGAGAQRASWAALVIAGLALVRRRRRG